MEREEGDKEEEGHRRKAGENEQWQIQVIMPSPVKAIRAHVLNVCHMTLTHYFLISASQIPQIVFDRSANDHYRKRNLT